MHCSVGKWISVVVLLALYTAFLRHGLTRTVLTLDQGEAVSELSGGVFLPLTSGVFFLHIPKTGGSALTKYLRRMVGCEPEYCMGDPKSYERCTKVGSCAGHDPFPRGYIAAAAARDNDPRRPVVTLLRDPVARLLSAYGHARQVLDAGGTGCCGIKPVSTANGTFIEFARAPGNRNQMTKMFVGWDTYATDDPAQRWEEWGERYLKQVQFVGITEYFNASVAALSELSGVPFMEDDLYVTRLHPPEYAPPTLSKYDRARVESWNHLDMALYARLRRQFLLEYGRFVDRG